MRHIKASSMLVHAVRSISTLAGGAATAQVLGILALPFIARAYGPNSFGEYSVALVVITLVSAAGSLQLHQAVVVARSDSHASRLMQCTNTASAVASAAALLIYTLACAVWVSSPSYLFGLLLAASVWAVPVGLALQSWMVRKARINVLALTSLVKIGTMVSTQLALTQVTNSATGLLSGYLVGELAAISVSLYYLGREGRRRPLFWWRASFIRNYRDFTIYSTAQELMNTASQGVPTLILGAFLGTSVAGAYSMAVKITVGPANIIASAVRNTVAPMFMRSAGTLRSGVIYWSAALGLAVAGPALVMHFFGGRVVSWVLGEQWSAAASYAEWLALWAVMLIVNAPATMALRVARKQREAMYFNATVLVVRTLFLAIAATVATATFAVAGFSILGVALNAVLIIYVIHEVGSRPAADNV